MEEKEHKLKGLRYSARRLESLTDGIFGFAMTLLVINLNAPILHGLVTNQELIASLSKLQNHFFTFLVSFLLLASAWGVHHRQFSFIKESDGTLMWINMVRLLFVITIPFSAVLVSNYPNLPAAVFFFAMNIFLLSLASYIEWKYAATHDMTEGLTPEHIHAGDVKNMLPLIVTGVVCISSLFAPEISLYLYLLIPIGLIVLRKFGRIL